MRLFSAVFPDETAARHLEHAVRGLPERVTQRPRWHITLCFHGEEEPGPMAERLRARLTGMPAPRLRLAGSGRFGAVYFAAVDEAEPGVLRELALACGAGWWFHPHLTLSRAVPGDPLAGYSGPWFTAPEAALVASEGGRYTVLRRFPLCAK
ncbi:2'-5' RNA ligase family protein [Sciscionella marina]|uniref:2'-5' RNA ligase family protein n=1 Tax=Sciscionella marina TaxID=508770 RepID=UPI00035DCFB1|nr:2'-5' RNA ligase family protein [Sciscionella marina]